MIGAPRLLKTLARVVARSRADATSVCAHASTRRVFRFAYGGIHQDLIQEEVSVTVTVRRGRRVGIATVDTLDPPSLGRCVTAALDLAAHAPTQTDLAPLPPSNRLRTRADYDPRTVGLSAVHAVHAIQRLVHVCRGVGAELAGSLLNGEDELAVATSAGTSCYAASTVAGAKLVTMYRALSGYTSGVARRFNRLDLEVLLERALRQCLHRQDPVTLPLGAYEVILEPEAVAELLDWLGSIAFGAKALQERISFLAGRIGEPLMSRELTVYDDATESKTLRMPFDYEGVPKRRVLLIDRGRAAGVVYDSLYAQRVGASSTGHAMWPGEVEGPLPMHLAIRPGRRAAAELIRRCRRGLLIPRVHYVNGLLNPREALMTGLLREGAFLIEHGKLVAPVTTMRFTQSLLEAFRQVRGISRERRAVADPSSGLGCSLVPTLHLGQFHFTGRSSSNQDTA